MKQKKAEFALFRIGLAQETTFQPGYNPARKKILSVILRLLVAATLLAEKTMDDRTVLLTELLERTVCRLLATRLDYKDDLRPQSG